MELYIEIKTEMRDAKDAVLKKHGIGWLAWLKLCEEVERAFPDEGIKSGAYEFRVEKKDIETYRKVDAKIIGQVKRVSLHSIR